MSKPEVIKIDEVEYVRRDSTEGCKGDIKIVVLDRGFVYVGHVEVSADWVTITRAQNIRVWGTSKGLGELRNGPLSGTKLDNVGTVKAPTRALISLIDVEQKAWKLF